MHARDPHGILKKFLNYFSLKEENLFKQKLKNLEQISSNETVIRSEGWNINLKNQLLHLELFLKNLTDQLGENIPLDTERGYHVHFKNQDHLISRPVIFLDRGFGMTPMNQGLRAVGTVELGGLNNPPSKKRIEYIINCAKELFHNLENMMMNG